MTAEERSLLEALDAIVGSEEVRAQIYPIVERVRTELARNKEGADDLGADSGNDLRWRVAVGDSLQLGFRPARRRDHGSRTPSEQSSTDDVVRSGWRFASPSRAVGRRPRAVAVQSFGE